MVDFCSCWPEMFPLLKLSVLGLEDATDFLNFLVIDSRPAKIMSSIEMRFAASIRLMFSGEGSSELVFEMSDGVEYGKLF